MTAKHPYHQQDLKNICVRRLFSVHSSEKLLHQFILDRFSVRAYELFDRRQLALEEFSRN